MENFEALGVIDSATEIGLTLKAGCSTLAILGGPPSAAPHSGAGDGIHHHPQG